MKTRIRPQLERLEGRTLLSAGNLDAGFGGTGKVATTLSGNDYSHAVAVQIDGKVVVGGLTIAAAGTKNAHDAFGLVRYNIDGTLDGSFGSGGKAVLSGTDDFQAMALTPDGKIVSVGTTILTSKSGPITQSQRAWAVARTNANGAADTTFGSSGRAVTDLTPGDDTPTALAVQPDGKVVVVGYGGASMTAWEVVRYNVNGTLDGTFGSGGKAAVSFTAGPTTLSSEAFGVTLDAQGHLLVVGTGSLSGGANQVELARLNPNGTLDTTFGIGGKVLMTPPGAISGQGHDIGLQSTGQIIVTGLAVFTNTGSGNFPELYAARFNPTDGSLDTSFGPSGNGFGFETRMYPRTNNTMSRQLVVQPDDKIVVAGSPWPYTQGFALLRMTAAGAPDSTFGSGGMTFVAATNTNEWPTAIALAPDGKIVMSGYSSSSTGTGAFTALRFLGDSTVTTLRLARPAKAHAGSAHRPGAHPRFFHAFSHTHRQPHAVR